MKICRSRGHGPKETTACSLITRAISAGNLASSVIKNRLQMPCPGAATWRFVSGLFVSPASVCGCRLAFLAGLHRRLACWEFYDLRRPSSELDADRSGHYLGLDFPFLAVTAVDASVVRFKTVGIRYGALRKECLEAVRLWPGCETVAGIQIIRSNTPAGFSIRVTLYGTPTSKPPIARSIAFSAKNDGNIS
jgi:hypothetical protein